MFEVAVVYREKTEGGRGRLWLAVAPGSLACLARGRRLNRSPKDRSLYEPVRAINVAELCERWGVPVEQLDQELAAWFAPRAEGRKPEAEDPAKAEAVRARRAARRRAGSMAGTAGELAAEEWRERRTHRRAVG